MEMITGNGIEFGIWSWNWKWKLKSGIGIENWNLQLKPDRALSQNVGNQEFFRFVTFSALNDRSSWKSHFDPQNTPETVRGVVENERLEKTSISATPLTLSGHFWWPECDFQLDRSFKAEKVTILKDFALPRVQQKSKKLIHVKSWKTNMAPYMADGVSPTGPPPWVAQTLRFSYAFWRVRSASPSIPPPLLWFDTDEDEGGGKKRRS